MKELKINPIKMTPKVMLCLEEKRLITVLSPSRDKHRLNVQKNEGKGGYLYKSDIEFGSHSLVNVAIDNETFTSFATHPDKEEFLLLGGINERPMYLLIAYDRRKDFIEKIESGGLTEKDLICLDCAFNDPYCSFFIMHEDVPHGECAYGEGRPATFYVTEGGNLPLEKIDLYKHFKISIVGCL